MHPSSYSPSWYQAFGGIVVKGISYLAGGGSTTPYEDRVEEFGLLASLALGLRLPEGSKPARSNHRIIWNIPEPIRPTDSTTIDKQGATRRVSHLFGYTNTDHNQIISKWFDDIQNAIKIHLPKNLNEQDPFIVDCKISICRDAIEQLKCLYQIYLKKNDGTDRDLKFCIRCIESRLEQDDIAQRLARSSLSPSASLSETKAKEGKLIENQGLEEKEVGSLKGGPLARTAALPDKPQAASPSSPTSSANKAEESPSTAPPLNKEAPSLEGKESFQAALNQPKVVPTAKETPQDKALKSPPIAIPSHKKQKKRTFSNEELEEGNLFFIENTPKRNSLSWQGSGYQAPLTVDEKMAALWQERFLFEALQSYFRTLDSIPLSERVESNHRFSATIAAIDGLLYERSSFFEKHLLDSTQYTTK